MLDVTIDLVPFGFDQARRKIGGIKVVNDATGTEDYAHYDITVSFEHGEDKHFRLADFPRKFGWTALLWEILDIIEHGEEVNG